MHSRDIRRGFAFLVAECAVGPGLQERLDDVGAVLDPAATVTSDVGRLRSARSIPARVTVSGHVYDVVTGLVQTVIPAGRRGDRTVP